MSGVQDLIDAIDSGDSTTIDAAFEAEMASRISTKLDDMKVDIAQNMFKSQQEVTDELSAEEVEDELDVEVQDTADTPVEESEVEEIADETEQQEV